MAEEVEDVLPELVMRNAVGEVEAVSYHEMPAMLLNELQKQQKTIEQQAKENERQDALITELLARLAAIEEGRAANGGR